jgi:hypothetical protein
MLLLGLGLVATSPRGRNPNPGEVTFAEASDCRRSSTERTVAVVSIGRVIVRRGWTRPVRQDWTHEHHAVDVVTLGACRAEVLVRNR